MHTIDPSAHISHIQNGHESAQSALVHSDVQEEIEGESAQSALVHWHVQEKLEFKPFPFESIAKGC